MTLSVAALAALSAIDVANTRSTFSGLKPFFSNGLWLGKGNCYSVKAVEKIDAEMGGGGLRNPRHLAQYIAASSYLHCIDGWSYLGRAAGSVLKGDPHRALHLAYYAELRAAMALMATQGVGIFNTKHFAVSANNAVAHINIRKGTHEFAWLTLQHWAAKPNSGQQFAEVIAPYGRSLVDWLHPVGGPSVIAAQARDWFQGWGMDLDYTTGDRRARNESTYRPDGVPRSWRLQPTDAVKLVEEVWTALEPTGSRFETIDRHILRLAVEQAFKSTKGKNPRVAKSIFKIYVKGIVDNQAFDNAKLEKFWTDFLLRKIEKEDHSLLTYSRIRPGSPKFKKDHAAIIARATLLLRIATGSACALSSSSGIPGEVMDFWHSEIGEGRGLWKRNSKPDHMSDLWADVKDAIKVVEEWRNEHPVAERTFKNIGEKGGVISQLSSCERVALWGMTSLVESGA